MWRRLGRRVARERAAGALRAAAMVLGATAGVQAAEPVGLAASGRWALLSGGCKSALAPASGGRCRTPGAKQWLAWQAWDIHCSNSACRGRIAFAGGTFARAGSFQLARSGRDRVGGVVLGNDGRPLATLWARVHRHSLRGYLRAVGGTGRARFVLPVPPGMSMAVLPERLALPRAETAVSKGGER
ncbi:MAG: hypothetical protein KatS3mg077_1547 [Candidatus Binatia bacterium]|nr:MAG: hypothetical protein KatS3mg077_1537 [Candidatus Binatia bacterium]GIW44265.1 MAG: hypothetical protein KatS3mg077_1547 [Candidatus Binatia bacterium]